MKKKVILLLLISLVCITGKCQIVLGKLGTEALVEDAVKEGFVLVGTQYQLKEKATGNLYGRGGRNYYGELYSLGYLFPCGCILAKESLRPWDKDPAFEKYRKNEKYIPVLMDTITLKTANRGASHINCLIRGISNVPNTRLSNVSLELSGHSGFPLNQELGQLSGWFVWCMIPKDGQIGRETEFSFTSLYRTIEIKDTMSIPVEAPKNGEKLLGGIFVVPKVDSLGKITLYTKGILCKISNDKWGLRIYNEEWDRCEATVKEGSAETTKPTDEGELNLVTSGKKNKAKSKKKK